MNLYDIAIARKLSGGGGGGGSSDFTTATVTIANNTNKIIICYCPSLFEVDEYDTGFPALIANAEQDAYSMSSEIFSAPLYKGSCLLRFDDEVTATITGSATQMNSMEIIVTGDCTITIS